MREELFLNIIKEALPESSGMLDDDSVYIPEKDLIITQDSLIEEVHFRQETISPYYLGRKSIAVNLSDIAACGGIPRYVMISLSMPKNIDEKFIRDFYNGVGSICREYNVIVTGGDLTAAEKISISVCALGEGKGLIPASRKNAKPQDIIIVTGNFGSSVCGLGILEKAYKQDFINVENFEEISTKFINSHINPAPRINEGRKILELAKNPAMMDSSDGLADALYKISLISKVNIEVDFDLVPYDKDIEKFFCHKNLIRQNLFFGGEDYELVATVSDKEWENIKELNIAKKIGFVTKKSNNPEVHVKFKEGETLKLDSNVMNLGLYNHFEK